MPTYLDLLPNELYRKIYEIVHKESIEIATKIGKRRQLPCIGQKTNESVMWHWINGFPHKSLRMSTNGEDIYSYGLAIGHTISKNKDKILLDYTAKGLGYYSQTTSTHVNKCRKYADKIITKSTIS